MVTVDRIGNLRVVIYTNDHRPPHVHVIGDGKEAVFKLIPETYDVLLIENYGFSRTALTKIKVSLNANIDKLFKRWEGIHDPI